MPLGTEVGLGAGDLVLDGAKLLPLKGAQPQFRPMSVVAKQLDGSRCQLVRRHRPRLSAGDIVLDGSLAPPKKGARPNFRPLSTVVKLSCC